MRNRTGNCDVPLPVHLQRSKLKADPCVSQLSAASLGYPWYCTSSAEGASAAGQWLWLCFSSEGWCLKAFLEGSHAARAPRRRECYHKHTLPWPKNTLASTSLAERDFSCLQRSASRQAFQIHLFLPTPWSIVPSCPRGISLSCNRNNTLPLSREVHLACGFHKCLSQLNTSEFCISCHCFGSHIPVFIDKESQSKKMENW